MSKKIICIDFDGVLHSYTSGWKGIDVITDKPVEQAIEWLKMLINEKDIEPCIYSSRSKEEIGIYAMTQWLIKYGMTIEEIEKISFPKEKPSAWLTIDDRVICFGGIFPDLEKIRNFKPWHKEERWKYLMGTINDICKELNWSIAIPEGKDGSNVVRGLIIGEDEYLDEIVL